MEAYEENLLRLNKKIRDLMAHIDNMETKNIKLQKENSVLVEDVANFRVQYSMAEESRLQFKSLVEKQLALNNEQHESHQLLKRRYNDLIKEYVAQNHKLRAYETKVKIKQNREDRKTVPVEIIGKLSDIEKPKLLEDKVTALERRCVALEKELQKAYAVIDDMEFELESIDLLEDTNQRLEKQVRDLKSELSKHSQSAAATTPTYSLPSFSDSIYTFESNETAECSKQDESKEYQPATPVTDKLNDGELEASYEQHKEGEFYNM